MKNKVLNKTADILENSTLARFVFYTTLLTTPVAATVGIYDLATPDNNRITTEQSTKDTKNYIQQVEGLKAQYNMATMLDKAIPNQQGADAVFAMQQKQKELYQDMWSRISTFKTDVLTDPDLTEPDFKKITYKYNYFVETTKDEYKGMDSYMSGALEECRAPALSTKSEKTAQADAVAQCLDNESPSIPLWMLIYGLIPLSLIGLSITGLNNDDKDTDMPKQTAKLLRKKSEIPKSH